MRGYAGPVFRRKSAVDAPETTAPVKEGGKGRPTPTRKEAEAARRARAKTPRSRKEVNAAQRAARAETSAKMRDAMKTGDERYLPARDKGPVKRFVRDFVDARFSFIELMIPVLVITMVLGYSGQARLAAYANALLMGTLLLIAFEMIMLRFRLKRELTRRFPDESHKGLVRYAIFRGLQMKFMRLPKAKVKIGERLPESYR